MEITISGQNRRLLRLVEQLARELGLSISKTSVKTHEQTLEEKK